MRGVNCRDMKYEVLNIGDKVDLYMGRGPYYRTTIDDIEGNRDYVVTVPSYRGIPIIVRNGQRLQMFFYRQNGRYAIDAKVTSFEVDGQVRLMKLRALGEPEKQQRRESFRFHTSLKVIIRPFVMGPFPMKPDPEEADEMEEASTFNISATGIALKTKRSYEHDEKFYLQIYLNPDGPPLEILCAVRQASRVESVEGPYFIGAMFMDIAADVTTIIAKFVLDEERKQVKQSRLVEEE